MKPYALYIMMGFAIILDILSLLLIAVANGPGIIIGILGFMNSAIFITSDTVASLAYVATKEAEYQQKEKQESDPAIVQKMKKTRIEFVDKIKMAFINSKIWKLVMSGIGSIIASIPLLGSFVPSFSIATGAAIYRHNKNMKLFEEWKNTFDKNTKRVRGALGGGSSQGVAASTLE